MYPGVADPSLTAELVRLFDVPVLASGDITSRERALQVLAETGAAAVMIARASQGNPWLLRELAEGVPANPSRAEIVAELVRFIREIAREMGEERSVGWLRKFYGWYLHGGLLPKPVKAELAAAPTLAQAEAILLREAPEAEAVLASIEAEVEALGAIEDDTHLDLPISIFAGG